MIDRKKRRTLKQAGITVAVSVLGITTGSKAAWHAEGSKRVLNDTATPELSQIDVRTRISTVTNDLEVALINTGAQDARITQLTPSHTTTPRGTFDFSQLLKDGPIVLAPGQSVGVPIATHVASVSGFNATTAQSQSLSSALRRSMSVVTDNESFASVNVIDGLQYA